MTPDDALQALSRLTYLVYDVKGSRYARLIQPDESSAASSTRSACAFLAKPPRHCRQ